MNRKWLVPLLALAAAGAVAYAVTRSAVRERTVRSVDRLEDVSFLVRELELDDSQAAEIRALHADLGSRLNDCCARHCKARARLGRALAGETNETAQTEAVLVEMCRAYEDGERATLDRIRKVRAVLNAKQKQRFDAMISRCMCRGCGGHCGEAGGTCRD